MRQFTRFGCNDSGSDFWWRPGWSADAASVRPQTPPQSPCNRAGRPFAWAITRRPSPFSTECWPRHTWNPTTTRLARPIQDIPQDLYEAAEIDGASHFTQRRTIVRPLIVMRDHSRLPVMVQLIRMAGEYSTDGAVMG